MNTNEKRDYEIVGGPNRDVLFDACKYAYDKYVRFSVSFTVAIGYTMPKSDPRAAYVPMEVSDFKICGIEHEAGSGESFNLKGYCRAKLDLTSESRTYNFKAWYNTKTREGTISFS